MLSANLLLLKSGLSNLHGKLTTVLLNVERYHFQTHMEARVENDLMR